MIRIASNTGFSRGSRGAVANGESDMIDSLHASEELSLRGVDLVCPSSVGSVYDNHNADMCRRKVGL